MSITVRVYQDTRKETKSGIYPVSLIIYDGSKQRRCPVYFMNLDRDEYKEQITDRVMKITPDEFKKSVEAKRVTGQQHIDIANMVASQKTRAENIIRRMPIFNYDKFLAEYTGLEKNSMDVIQAFNSLIDASVKSKSKKIKTLILYKNAIKSLIRFQEYQTGKPVTQILFTEITVQFLRDYQSFMLNVEILETPTTPKKKKASKTTVSMYVRSLKKVYNDAVRERIIRDDINPFGKDDQHYSVPVTRKSRQSLTSAQVIQFFYLDVAHRPAVVRARAYWFFAFFSNGMSFVDIAHLKYGNIKGDFFYFTREKIDKRVNGNEVRVKVYINEYIQSVFDEYGNKDKSPNNYIFPILNHSMTDYDVYRAVDNFTNRTNKRIKSIVKLLGWPEGFTTYIARHTFATSTMQLGKNSAFLQKSLGQRHEATAEIYKGDFEEDEIRQTSKDLFGKFQLQKQVTG